MDQDNTGDNNPRVIVVGAITGDLGDAIRRVAANEGGEHDWRRRIDVPRPRMWKERPDLIGQTVVPHTCHARVHGDNVGCICSLIGKSVKIVNIVDSLYVGTPSYCIEGSDKRVQEREFSEETR